MGALEVSLKRRARKLARRVAAASGIPDKLDRLGAEVATLEQQLQSNPPAAPSEPAAAEVWKPDSRVSVANGGQGTQVLLKLLYQDRLLRGDPLPALDDVEFRVHSQNGEDGILLFLFSVLGAPSRRCIEMCVGDGIECNAANLVINHGWRALMVDGDPANVAHGTEYYRVGRDTSWSPPTLVQAWVTADSVNELITDAGFAGPVDLLSVDLDGVDYWIWKAVTAARPRVVVAEYNWTWGPERRMTVPYAPDFTIPSYEWRPAGDNMYFGASLAALTALGAEKGYRLVGCQRWGFNAFFVEEGIGEDVLPAVSPEACFDSPVMRMRWAEDDYLPVLKTWDWVEV